MKKLVRLFLFLSFVSFFSCKKESNDKQAPTLSISSPSAGNTYHMFDTFKIVAQCSDETALSSISIVLRDMNGNAVQAAGSESLSGKSRSYSTSYVLSEFRIKTGDYLLEVNLSDGNNVTTKTVQIHIIESPTYLTGFYIIHTSSTSNTVNKYDTSFVNTNIISQVGAYQSSEVSSYYQQLYLINAANQSFKAINIGTNQNNWYLSNIGIPNSNCTADANKIYYSRDQGNVISYNHQGNLSRSYLSNEMDYYAKHIFTCGKYLVVNLEHNTTSTSRKIVIFEISTGTVKYVLNDNTECTQAFSHSDSEIYLIINNNTGNSLIGNLNMTSLNYNQPLTSTSKINSSTLVDSDNIVFSTADGNIKQYTYSNGNLVNLQSSTITNKLYYSSISNKLYSAQAKNLVVYNKSAFAISFDRQYICSDTIRNFHLIYNK